MLRLLLFIFLLFTQTASAADLPAYLNEALTRFTPDLPSDWAYTIKTQRGHESSVERYDPSLPPEQHWTLLQRNQQSATIEDISRYRSYRVSTSRSTHATFLRSDIDLSTLRLIHEDEIRAEFIARFREGLEDPLLQKLELYLSVAKQPAVIEQFAIQLTEPYSPVLTVKMLELRVETTLSPPATDRPALPLRVTSHFRGRVLLIKSIEEDVQSSYSEYTKVILPTRQPASSSP